MDSVDLNVSTLKPLGERVLVKMDKTEEKTTGGILLPDNAKKKTTNRRNYCYWKQ